MKNTRGRILKISFRLFLQKSYKEVTLKEIAEKAGMSKGAFYHYFDSKEKIFLEIINTVFAPLIDVDFSQFNRETLYEFYHDYIDYLGRTYESFRGLEDGNFSLGLNSYSLIFDAIRHIPNFRERMLKSMQVELEAWKEIVRIAKSKNEIKSSMSDEQISSIFIHINSGVGMSNIMMGKDEKTTSALLNLWDSYYSQIKQ